ncbi:MULTISPECIES: LacI family DNA-binding transcriptional regulator [Alkalimonas]|uniref:LacI family DNA-binding transcriptional regulator n=2 Tax=Alkalimonas TaxID=265980 RepID=A0ABU7J2F1_9GAMM|nr:MULTISPECIES: LacI family DNA-binding transcriptional regulator [unclassified Alkalimonas]MEE2000202.1 LacI family DNA-binding transcriptional regulator [Alkalimonas sp. MEB108]MEE2022715.1 LacI family DNA-binding transcriptional regulator [Alkalimonas sp. MEB004]
MIKMKQATINDVARIAGVSKRTVSRVINGSLSVGEHTRTKVQNVINELKYSPNTQARGLASSRSYLLGLIYDNPDALYLDSVQRGVLEVCSNLGYELVVHPCRYQSPTLVQDCLRFISRSKLDGIIVLPPVSELEELAQALKDSGRAYVRLSSVALDEPCHIVVSDDRAASAEMARYFAQLGHEKIAFITGPQAYKSTIERMEGFQLGLSAYGIQLRADWIVEGDNSYEKGIECARQLLLASERPTAIYANNDQMAAGVLKVAHELGIAVPAQLSVAGFDDNMLASRVIPSLTTIRRPVRQMALLAATKMIMSIENNDKGAEQVAAKVAPTLVVRESTAKVRQS